MSQRRFGFVVVVFLTIALLGVGLAAQEPAPKTPWGHPDLQGVWTNSTTTPMERPSELGEQAFLTEEERAARVSDSGITVEVPSDLMPTGAYNDYWLEQGELSLRTSLIVDPPNGQYPPLTPEATQRRSENLGSFANSGFDTWEDLSTYDRCITRGMPGAMTPGFYNHNYQILQTPDHVVLFVEMIHDARIIPLEGAGTTGAAFGQWLGTSRGRWDGDTLVIETTNLPETERRVEERLTRVDADTIDYQITVTDPNEWTDSWTAIMPMNEIEGPLFEYACHEGNYAVPNMLAGSRAEDGR